jgi:hypothetical protein
VSASELIRCIGLSHLLQPPLTLLLSVPSGVDLKAQLVPKTRLAAEVMKNMALASVFLPTSLGVLVAIYSPQALEPGPARALCGLVSAFWCWRLYRQLFVLRPVWPSSSRLSPLLNALLTLIFVVQGPGLGLLLLR